jgi:hypothetical protein
VEAVKILKGTVTHCETASHGVCSWPCHSMISVAVDAPSSTTKPVASLVPVPVMHDPQ